MEQTKTTEPIMPSREYLSIMAKNALEARTLCAYLKAGLGKEYAAFEESHAAQIAQAKEAAEMLATCESGLREYAVRVYQETGDKHPGPGINIRDITKLVYDAPAALAWAKHHDVALALDKSTFEKIARVTPPDFVEIVVEHQATIATDLEKALREKW